MKVYGLLGKNIGYSLSPFMHNIAFRALDIKAEYRIFDIPGDGLQTFFSDLRSGKITGCNVTIPYKEEALGFIDECAGLAGDIGAINTVARKGEKLCGYNTDYEGFVGALKGKKSGDLGFDPKGKEAFVFGAGGAAKAVIYGLITSGARRIAIADIDNAKAEKLASSVIATHRGECLITVVKDEGKYEEFISKSDLLVNATPCGMKEEDEPLFDYRYITDRLCIFELVYAAETPLLREARKAGAEAIGGLNMLLYQAEAAFTLWTGKRAPIEVMRKVALERIKR